MGKTTIFSMRRLIEEDEGEAAATSEKRLDDIVNQEEPVLDEEENEISYLAPLLKQLKVDPSKIKTNKTSYNEGSYITFKTTHLSNRGTNIEDVFIIYAAGNIGDRIYTNTLRIRRETMIDMYSKNNFRRLLSISDSKELEKKRAVLDLEVSHYGHIIKWSEGNVYVDHLYDATKSRNGSSIDKGQLLKEAVTNFRYVNHVIKTMMANQEKAIDMLNKYVTGDEEDPDYGKIERYYEENGLKLNLKGVDHARIPINSEDSSPEEYESRIRVIKGRENHSRYNGYITPVEEGMVFFWKEIGEKCSKIEKSI